MNKSFKKLKLKKFGFIILLLMTTILNPDSGASAKVKTKSEWKGKKVAILGDSMSDPGKKVTNKWYYTFLAENLGIIPLPYAKSGYTWKNLELLANQMEQENGDDLDAIFIWAGTNDYRGSVPIGDFFNVTDCIATVGGNEEIRKVREFNLSEDTFSGRINKLLGHLKSRYPEKTIILFTPIHRGYAKFSDKNEQLSEEYSNSIGLFIDDYVNALKRAGEIWSVPVIDLFGESGILPAVDSHTIFIADTDTDRLHPNERGHHRIAKIVEKHLSHIPASISTDL